MWFFARAEILSTTARAGREEGLFASVFVTNRYARDFRSAIPVAVVYVRDSLQEFRWPGVRSRAE
jgi:hypothetical protein